uniref:Coiled-coil domain-containing protein 130 homolog n=1 Tax=Rhabditophanes sp. KR3021 TaxID=114890 RepID=A0AC35TN71_9BILA
MGERKGQLKYYPPDFDYKKHSSLNAYHGTHALRERAKKIKQGILVIRFEMPYNIWCAGCESHVAMGVRFNAEKKKVGKYYTTPIFEFDMKCMYCDTHYVIRTDPKNFDYAIVSGARRQEKRFDPSEIANLEPVDREMGQKLDNDAMLKLQHVHDDKKKSETNDKRLSVLKKSKDPFKDDFRVNSLARLEFRTEKEKIKSLAEADIGFRSSIGLGNVKLADETPEIVEMTKKLMRGRSFAQAYQPEAGSSKSSLQKMIQSSTSIAKKRTKVELNSQKKLLLSVIKPKPTLKSNVSK